MVQTCNSDPCCDNVSSALRPEIFAALADASRNALLVELTRKGCPCSVSELSECCPVDVSVVSRHLTRLREAGIVEARKDGRHVYYEVRYSALASALRELADALEACCPEPQVRKPEPAHG